MLRKYISFMVVMFALILPLGVAGHSMQPPVRVGGTITIDGKMLTQKTAVGVIVKIFKPKEEELVFLAADDSGLNNSNHYIINIPVYDKKYQPKGVLPGEILKINIYKGARQLNMPSPKDGIIQMGESGSILKVNLEATK